MIDPKNAVASFDQSIQENRKQRNEILAQQMLGKDPKKLAQDMLGKQRRSNTPRPTGPSSLASRVGISKRSTSLPRMHPVPSARYPRTFAPLTLPPLTQSVLTTDNTNSLKSNDSVERTGTKRTGELSFKGAAGGPYIVMASNFAPGTSETDIESVMRKVGGDLTYCKVLSYNPIIIAEVGFVDKAGADKVIATFNNNKADGRILYVYYQKDGGAKTAVESLREDDFVEPTNTTPVDAMEIAIDENAEARQEQDRLREERRGREERMHRNEVPSDFGFGQYYPRESRRVEPEYRNGRYGYGRGSRGPRDERYNSGRMYSDGPRRGEQSYRP